MIKCAKCGGKVSQFATSCPNCGCKVSDMNAQSTIESKTPAVEESEGKTQVTVVMLMLLAAWAILIISVCVVTSVQL